MNYNRLKYLLPGLAENDVPIPSDSKDDYLASDEAQRTIQLVYRDHVYTNLFIGTYDVAGIPEECSTFMDNLCPVT